MPAPDKLPTVPLTARAPWSLRVRILITGTVVVALFMLLAGIALERAFRATALTASGERLQSYIYMLMAATELSETGDIIVGQTLPDPLLSVPDSGVLAAVTDGKGSVLWRSESSLVATLIYPLAGAPGQPLRGTSNTGSGDTLYTLAYPVIWELESGAEYPLVFHAAESGTRVEAAIAAFRATLQLWLGGAGLCLLLLQAALLVWALQPLARITDEISALEAGEDTLLTADYPDELQPLTSNLNALLLSGRARMGRYRDALADLAHSLKTPLAVMRSMAGSATDNLQQARIAEQLDRMDATISYHLQRAATSGRSPLTAPVNVRDAVARITASLEKVYHDKDIHIGAAIAADVQFTGDPGDLAEVLGNLGDNACKWGRTRVRISAANDIVEQPARLHLIIEDDGPGIPDNVRDEVLHRGVRADRSQPGHGIGLAIVQDIVVDAYGGALELGVSEWGGARIDVRI